jgi:uncharacterized protein YkwD
LTRFQKASLAFLSSLVVLTTAAIVFVYFGAGDTVLEVRIVNQREASSSAPVVELPAVLEVTVTPLATASPTPIPPTLAPTATATRPIEPSATSTWPRPTATPSLPALTLSPTSSATPPPNRTARVASAKLTPTPQTYAALEARAVDLINQARQADGRAPVVRDPGLDLIARARSEDMAKRHYFSHEDPQGGKLPLEKLLIERKVAYQQAGENIAFFQGQVSPEALPQMATEKWLQSPPHKENLMDSGYNVTGFGIARAETSEGTIWYLTQVFVQR